MSPSPPTGRRPRTLSGRKQRPSSCDPSGVFRDAVPRAVAYSACMMTVAVTIGVVLAALSQVSLVAVGDQQAGSTFLLWKGDQFNGFRFLESAKARCGGTSRRETLGISENWACMGSLAISANGSPNKLLRLPFSDTIVWMSEIGRSQGSLN